MSRFPRRPPPVPAVFLLLAGCGADPPAAPPGPAAARAPEFAPPSPASTADSPPGDPPRLYPSGSPVTMRRKADVAPPRLLLGHAADVFGVAVSPDGRLAYTASLDGTVRKWGLATGREVRRFPHPSFGRITPTPGAVAVSPDGRRLYTGTRGPGAAVRAWDVAGGAAAWATGTRDPPHTREEVRLAYEGGSTAFWDLAVSPDGASVYAAADDAVRTFAAADGAEGRRFVPPPPPAGTWGGAPAPNAADPTAVRVEAVSLSRDGNRLAAVCVFEWDCDFWLRRSFVWEWDLTVPDDPPVPRCPPDVPFVPAAVAYDPRGTLVVAGNRSDRPNPDRGAVFTYERDGQRYDGPLPMVAGRGDFAVTPDGLYAITGLWGAAAAATMLINDFPTGDLPAPQTDDATLPAGAHLWGGGLRCFAVTPGGRYVVAGTEGGAVLVWDAFEPE